MPTIRPTPLHEIHPGDTTTTVGGWTLAGDFGDSAAEAEYLRTAAGVIDRGARGRVWVAGDDTVEFLHAMVTHDVRAMPVGTMLPAALLDVKGRVISSLWMARR